MRLGRLSNDMTTPTMMGGMSRHNLPLIEGITMIKVNVDKNYV